MLPDMPNDCWINIHAYTDNVLQDLEKAPLRAATLNNIRHRAAAELVGKKVKETRHDFTTEYTLNLLVFTPDEFRKIVQEEARRLSLSLNYFFPSTQ